jgi:hypothetical protein
MCKASTDGFLTRLEKLKKKIAWKGIGVYVHVIVDKRNIRFCAGQSWELKKRLIDQHGNPSYRRSNPSLHYWALEKSDFDFYISFSECVLNDSDLSIRQNKLNMLEVSETSCSWCVKSCAGH